MLIKKILVAIFTVLALAMMSGCGMSKEIDADVDVVVSTQVTEEEILTTQPEVQAEEITADSYVGTYNDYDNNDPNLIISLNEDGTYDVFIGIFRLTSFEDGVGTLTDKGLEFVAMDASGNPIEGVITREGDEAVVTFTHSTWELIANGTSYRYLKAN